MGKQNKEAAITCKNGCVKAGLRPCKFVAKAVMELLPPAEVGSWSEWTAIEIEG